MGSPFKSHIDFVIHCIFFCSRELETATLGLANVASELDQAVRAALTVRHTISAGNCCIGKKKGKCAGSVQKSVEIALYLYTSNIDCHWAA